ncbi:hypothetical protein F070042J6_19300 [Bacteroides sp. f07]|uniref:hypothetical protein n=1 Tax=Bacteroides sp. f07 TaxID=3132704 RepID=UPI0034A8B698
MRYVVDAPMVAHLWAHQSQDSARNGRNFYFEGKDIYSYGSHFRCASIETNQQGQIAYLVTTRTYSSTTGKHMGMVRNAIPCGEQVFDTHRSVSLYKDKLSESSYCESAYYIVDQIEKISEYINAQQKSRTQNYTEHVKECLLNIGRWIEFWGLDKRQKSATGRWLIPVLTKLSSTAKKDKTKFWTVTGERPRYSSELPRENKSEHQELFLDILTRGLLQPASAAEYKAKLSQLFIDRTGDPLLWEHFAERKERQDAINRRNKELREQQYAERRERWLREEKERHLIADMSFEEKKELWYSGEISSRWFSIPRGLDFNALLRVRNGHIETSMGIQVKTKEAVRLWKLVELFHKNEADFRHDLVHDANNHNWTINSYKNDILTAGCHRISYEEMRNAARQLGIAA